MVYSTFRHGREQSITVEREADCITFCTEVSDLGLLMNEKWLRFFNGHFASFPIYELATFDIKDGHVKLELNSNNVEIYSIDATCDFAKWESTEIFHMLADDAVLWYQLCNGPLKEGLFAGKSYQFGVELLPAVTRFRNFNLEFYAAIPYGRKQEIPASFESIAQQIRTPEMAMEFLSKSGVSRWKSIKAILCNHPELLFYIEEIQGVYKALKNVDLLRTFLKNEWLFDILSQLHRNPGLLCFFDDYAKIMGNKALMERITKEWSPLISYGITNYISLREEDKEEERKKWRREKFLNICFERGPSFSIPMAKIPDNIPDRYSAYGFTFRPLRNSQDYRSLGQALENCLVGWTAKDNPVIGVFQSDTGDAVGAIEVDVDDGTVAQVRAFKNSTIRQVDNLYPAYDRWRDFCELDEDPFAVDEVCDDD